MRMRVSARHLGAWGMVLGSALSATALRAAELTDRLMAPGLFAADGEGLARPQDLLRYSHMRRLNGQIPDKVTEGTVALLHDMTTRTLALQVAESDRPARIVADFPETAPNPVLMFFLENIVRATAAQTGGSPFYIRNRIREALAASTGGTITNGQAQVTIRPFIADVQAARMGPFAKLSLTLVYDIDRPDRILDLLADTGPGPDAYTERLHLVGGL